MSILGVILRARDSDLDDLSARLAALPGVDVALRGPGRLVLVLEDTGDRSAAATLAEMTLWPQVLGTSLVYEYSGPDAPAPGEGVVDYRDWRASLSQLAGQDRPAS